MVPADLNGLMLKAESHILDLARTVRAACGAAEESARLDEVVARFEAAVARRREALRAVLWDPAAGRWRDLLLPERASDPGLAARGGTIDASEAYVEVRHTRGVRASDWVPLWCGAVTGEDAAAAVASLKNSGLVLPGGIATSLAHTGHQWDFPNAWAPLVHMLVEGCAGWGGDEGKALAADVARKWVQGNSRLLTSTGFMHEKYDAREVGGRAGGGGEYAPQRGFGWSNGVALAFIQKYCRDDD